MRNAPRQPQFPTIHVMSSGIKKPPAPIPIMASDMERPDKLIITTTDVHLPRRIGTAVHHAFHGDLKLHFDEDDYFIRVNWARDT